MGQAQAGLRLLGEALHGSVAAAPLAAATRALLAPELLALGWAARPGDDSETEALRAGLIRDLAAVDDTDVLARAQALFDDDEAGRAPMPAAVRAAVIGAVGRAADGRPFNALKRRLLAATSDDDRWRFASALARTPDAERAREVLALSLTDALPANLATRLPGMVSEARWHGELAYQHVVYSISARRSRISTAKKPRPPAPSTSRSPGRAGATPGLAGADVHREAQQPASSSRPKTRRKISMAACPPGSPGRRQLGKAGGRVGTRRRRR
jgi:hypothetical protein